MFNTKSASPVATGTYNATLNLMVLPMALGADTGPSIRTMRTSPFRKPLMSNIRPCWRINYMATTMFFFHLIKYEWLAPICVIEKVAACCELLDVIV